MAARGRPRKPGARQPNGRLRWEPKIDRGHELTLLHRAELIRGADPKDQRSSYPLGIHALRGDLADPGIPFDEAAEQTDLRLQAGLTFAGLHAVVWNGLPGRPNPFPRSHLAFAIAGACAELCDLDDDDRATILRRCSTKLRGAWARLALYGPFAIYIVEEIVIYEHPMRFVEEGRQPLLAERRQVEALRAGLAGLVREFR
jgi:hypothetical protein